MSIGHGNMDQLWVSGTLRYTPIDCYETFPFPIITDEELHKQIEKIGIDLWESRIKFRIQENVGNTKIYNIYHDQKNQNSSN
jgi:hypothetical protein